MRIIECDRCHKRIKKDRKEDRIRLHTWFRGGFDTQKWAEAVAEMMEEKWKNECKAGGNDNGQT